MESTASTIACITDEETMQEQVFVSDPEFLVFGRKTSGSAFRQAASSANALDA